MNVFPANPDARSIGQSFVCFTDPALRYKAQVFDMNGRPLAGSQVVTTGGVIPQFQSAAAVLYARDPAGLVETLYPHPNATQPIVTGAKGGNAALTSLIAALAAQGLIVDQTS